MYNVPAIPPKRGTAKYGYYTHLFGVYHPFTLTSIQIYQIRYAKGKAINAISFIRFCQRSLIAPSLTRNDWIANSFASTYAVTHALMPLASLHARCIAFAECKINKKTWNKQNFSGVFHYGRYKHISLACNNYRITT